jgi:hypothetical protein
MNHYTASVCIDDTLDIAAISCPRADLITYWSLKNNEYLSSEKFADGAGLTHIDKIYATSGKGRLIASKITSSSNNSNNNSLENFSFSGLRWDNHLTHIVA